MIKEEKLLKTLSQLEGISGFENEVAHFIKDEITPNVDKIEFDNLGSLIGYKYSADDQPLVMLCAHMDEVGFIVKHIEESGLIRIHNIGGWYNHVILNQLYVIKTKQNKKYFAISGAQPPHGMSAEQRSKVLELKDIYLDLGVKNKEAVKELGIEVGDSITPYQQYRVLNDGKTLLGKAWDDRIGCAVIINVLERLKKEKLDCNVAAAFSVQEEVGLRGAQTAANKIKPDIAFAIDVTLSCDLPSAPSGDTKLGNGIGLSIMDGSVIAHRGLFNFVQNIAKTSGIKYTADLLTAGGTDSGKIHISNDGVITMTLSIPCRYFHSHVSLINYDDFVATCDLVYAILKSINKDTLKQLQASKYE